MLLDYRHENRVQIEIGCDGGTNKTKGEKLETLKIPFFSGNLTQKSLKSVKSKKTLKLQRKQLEHEISIQIKIIIRRDYQTIELKPSQKAKDSIQNNDDIPN